MKVKSKRRAEFIAQLIMSITFIAFNSAIAAYFWTHIGIGGLR